MATRALLLCGEEKAVQVVTQILDELEVSFEHSSDSAFALKRLAAQHFDLLVVDCDNAQNATQVFNSARSSRLNKAAIAIAIVEGKAGVPNAFRLGASLVLTKPVSLDQARNTLRAGLGMTRKESPENKPSSSMATAAAASLSVAPVVVATPAPVAAPAASTPPVVPVVASPASPAPAVPVMTTPAPLMPLRFQAPAMAHPPTPSPVISDKPANSIVPTATPIAPPDAKPSLTDFKESAVPLGLAASKPAAAGPALTSSGFPKLDSIISQTENKITVAKPEVDLGKIHDSAAAPDDNEDLAVEDPFFDEVPDTAQTMRDGAVPSFGGLAKHPFAGVQQQPKHGSQGLLITAAILLLCAAGGYAAWLTQPSFRNLVAWEYEKAKTQIASFRGQTQVAASPQPQPTPAAPAPAPAGPAAPGGADASENAAATPEGSVPSTPEPTPAPSAAASGSDPSHTADNRAQKVASSQNAKQGRTQNATAIPALVQAAATNVPPVSATKPAADLFEVPEDYADDQVIHRVRPAYPRAARLKKVHGTVVLQAIVNKQGKVDSLQLLSGDPLLAQAAADAVKQWRYKPYSHNGEAAEFQTRVTVDFKLP